MATKFSYASIFLYSPPPPPPPPPPPHLRCQFHQKSTVHLFRCNSSMEKKSQTPNSSSFSKTKPEDSDSGSESESQNLLLKMAWYSSELLGIAASLVRNPKNSVDLTPVTSPEISVDDSGFIDRDTIAGTIKEDFQRSYFVTGNLTMDAYEEKCEFADPAGSFRGLNRFKRNCTNFGSLIQKSNMKLVNWEDFEEKSIGHWRFSCILSFPWKPILSATGYTEYYYDDKSGKICRHVEHWNVPKMALLKQIFRPSKGFI